MDDPFAAALSREHNDANVITMGARLIGGDMAKAALTLFFRHRLAAAAIVPASTSYPTHPPEETRPVTTALEARPAIRSSGCPFKIA
jgi:ribose/galactose isomerase